MASKIIELEDGILMEVEVPDDQMRQISGGIPDKVNKTISTIKPLLLKACQPVVDVWQELNKDMDICEAKVEISLGFEAEGNVFITKGKANASLTLALTLKPKVIK